jgi:hypothetical protein
MTTPRYDHPSPWRGVVAALREEQARKPHPTPSRITPPAHAMPGSGRRAAANGAARRAAVVAAVGRLGKPAQAGALRWRHIADAAGIGSDVQAGRLWREAVARGEVGA